MWQKHLEFCKQCTLEISCTSGISLVRYVHHRSYLSIPFSFRLHWKTRLYSSALRTKTAILSVLYDYRTSVSWIELEMHQETRKTWSSRKECSYCCFQLSALKGYESSTSWGNEERVRFLVTIRRKPVLKTHSLYPIGECRWHFVSIKRSLE